MSSPRTVVGVLMLFSSALIAAADEPLMPQPTPEHEALAVWTGTWSGQGEMKPGPFGPGGKMTWTEECTWFEGSKFNVICRSEGTGAMGPMKGLGIVGYNAGKGVYTHYGVDSTGWSGYSEGTHTGDTWTFQSKETMGDKTFHSRFEMKLVSPKNMEFSWAMSEDGTNWVVVMDGTSEKK
jgi:hypothetical protein